MPVVAFSLIMIFDHDCDRSLRYHRVGDRDHGYDCVHHKYHRGHHGRDRHTLVSGTSSWMLVTMHILLRSLSDARAFH